MPANPERVLAGSQPRPKLWSLAKELRPRMFTAVRLMPSEGPCAALQRRSQSRCGSNKKKCRTFYVHEERRVVHSIGEVRIVFSTKQQPTAGKQLEREGTKVLLTSAGH